jgi:hypothetical protein
MRSLLSSSSFALTALAFALSSTAAQQFADHPFSSVYPGMSDTCASALNTTIECPALLGIVSYTYDILSEDQLVSICIPECRKSLENVRSIIKSSCGAQTDVMMHGNVAYPATWVADTMMYKLDSSCQKDPCVQSMPMKGIDRSTDSF